MLVRTKRGGFNGTAHLKEAEMGFMYASIDGVLNDNGWHCPGEGGPFFKSQKYLKILFAMGCIHGIHI